MKSKSIVSFLTKLPACCTTCWGRKMANPFSASMIDRAFPTSPHATAAVYSPRPSFICPDTPHEEPSKSELVPPCHVVGRLLMPLWTVRIEPNEHKKEVPLASQRGVVGFLAAEPQRHPAHKQTKMRTRTSGRWMLLSAISRNAL